VSRRGQGMLRFASQEEFDRHRRSPRGLVDVALRESEILPAVLEALRKHPLVAWAHRVNTAAGYLIDAKTYHRLLEADAIKRTDARFIRFGWAGQLDLTGQMRDGRRLDVEVKTESGKLREEQAATIAGVRGANGVAFVARGVEDVFREIAS
jgi:hypothetical protein